jgi:Dolichyl-phosphate-mannose-protein mannosyltransferase
VSRRLALLALAAYVALLAATAPAWPDDWDGVGFLESVRDFDMARFHPHAPGYPVYVALLRLAFAVTREPMRACVLVAVASGGLVAVFVWAAAERWAGERAAWTCALLVAVCPLVWRACSGVGSEGPALACAAACVYGLAAGGPAGALAVGLGAGLGLGVRLSWAPVYLAALVLAPRGGRGRAWAASALACAAWAVPFVALVGPSRLWALYQAHLAGHAARWGGTVVTEPGAVRLAWLARDVFVDGIGAGADALGVGVAALACVAAAQAAMAWRAARWRGWPALLVAPYLLWIALGQNLRDQPRHTLPIVAAVAGVLALGAGRSRRAMAVVAALTLLIATRTALDAHVRRTVPPAGQQLVELARAQPSPARLAVFGVSSVRFFETTELASRGFTAGSLSDVEGRLARLDALPTRVWVTSELQGRDASPWPLVPVATLCRPERVDRRAPCLDVLEWKLPYLPR